MGTKLKIWFKQWNELKHSKHISILILAIIAIGVLALFSDYLCQSVTAFWEWLGKSGNSGAETNSTETNSATLRNLALAIFGSVGLILATWRTLDASRNTKIAEQNSFIAESNSITDAFTRAIEQLGSGSNEKPNIEVRLGAIYALERLSQNNGDYYQTIIDILASYVRQNAPIPDKSERHRSDTTRIDVQTAMTVIGRREVRPDEPYLNLFQVYLPFVKLMEARLQGANLIGAVLESANLREAKLQGATFIFAELQGAGFLGAELHGTSLENAELQGNKPIKNADLRGAIGLNCEQLIKANNWQSAYRDPELACGADIPEPPT